MQEKPLRRGLRDKKAGDTLIMSKPASTFVIPSPSLLASLGTHKRYRPLSPVETARELQNFLEKGGRPEQLPVSEETIREFLGLLALAETVKKMVGWGGISKGEIGMYSGYRISMLEKREDQEILARAVLERELTSKEVGRIVRHRNRHPEKSIEECIETVMAMRPIKRHLFITQMSDETRRKLEQEARMRNTSITNLLEGILSKEFPSGSLISLSLREDLVTLFLEKEGNEALMRKWKELGVSLKEVLDVIVLKHL